jgi:hypothetical protein
VEPTQRQQVTQVGAAAVGPVLEVVRVADPHRAGREAAAVVASLQSPAQGRRDHPGAPPHVEDGAVGGVAHGDHRRVAAEAPRRLRGDCARQSLEEGEVM